MATAFPSPSPAAGRSLLLLFDFMLASSWTWLALLLATIAATLRALQLRLPGLRLPAHADSASISPLPRPASGLLCETQASFLSSPLHRRFKHLTGSKSTPALGKVLLHSRGRRLWHRVFASVSDAQTSSPLKRTASESKICRGHHGSTQMCQRRRHQRTTDVTLGKTAEPKAWVEAEETHLSVPTLHSQWESAAEKSEDSRQWPVTAEDSCPHLPSLALCLCGPSQLTWSSAGGACAAESPSPDFAFEKQFGWDRLLDAKRGRPWSLLPRSDYSTPWQGGCASVVRKWDELPKKLVRKLHLDERRILALDTSLREGLACTGNSSGSVAMWELERRACARESTELRQPVVALSMDSDGLATAVVAGAASFCMWDRRSGPRSLNTTRISSGTVTGLNSRGSGLCVGTDKGLFSMYDLRKPCYPPVATSAVSDRGRSPPLPEHDTSLWEKFTRADEDAGAAEVDFAMDDSPAKATAHVSWLSRLGAYVRSPTFTP